MNEEKIENINKGIKEVKGISRKQRGNQMLVRRKNETKKEDIIKRKKKKWKVLKRRLERGRKKEC